MDPRKFDLYLFNPDHPANQSNAKGWSDTFGIGKDDGLFVERLIGEQLDRANVVEIDSASHREVPRKVTRKWELSIPEFEVPDRRPAPVVTVWGLASESNIRT